MKRIFKIMLIATVALFLNSCVSFVRPGFSKVKKIAIVSIQSNKAIYGKDMRGNDMLTLTGIASGLESTKKEGNPFIARLLNKTAERITQEFAGLPGKYQVISGAEVYNNPAYKAFIKNLYSTSGQGKLFQGQALAGYESLPDADVFAAAAKNNPMKIAINSLAKELGVDAVLLVDLDVYYQVTAELLGSGTADAKVGMYVYMVNADGEEAVGGMIYPQNQGEGPLGMLANNVFLDENTYPMFEKAMKKGVDEIVEAIQKGAK